MREVSNTRGEIEETDRNGFAGTTQKQFSMPLKKGLGLRAMLIIFCNTNSFSPILKNALA